MYEFERTITTLWSAVSSTPILRFSLDRSFLNNPHRDADFVTEHPEFVSPNSAMNFLSDNGGKDYNLCHCACQLPTVHF